MVVETAREPLQGVDKLCLSMGYWPVSRWERGFFNMLQHNKGNEKAQPKTFMDGINVKISEHYKPPRRVILPVSCQNSCLGEGLYTEYNFRLEENILNKIAEWKNVRREEAEQRNKRLKREAKVCEENFTNMSVGSTSKKGAEQLQQQLSPNLSDSVLTPTCAKQNSPSHKPISSNFNLSDFESDNSSPFDNMELKTINDMEVLASILSTNNMEQSKHKFNNNNDNHHHNINNNNNNNHHHHNNNNNIIQKNLGKNCLELNIKNNEWAHSPFNGYNSITYSNLDHNRLVAPLQCNGFNQFGFYPNSEHGQVSNCELNHFSNQFGAALALEPPTTAVNSQDTNIQGRSNDPCQINPPTGAEGASKCVPEIMLELEKELRETKEREEENKRRNNLAYLKESVLNAGLKDPLDLPETSRRVQSGSVACKLSDPTSSLSPSAQKLVKYISEMGFPPARTARACQMFENNDRKIIEFLVQAQKLEEKKYPGDLVEKALVISNFDLGECVKYLEAMMILLDLGFDEEKAEEALMATGIDRDKALDMLIS